MIVPKVFLVEQQAAQFNSYAKKEFYVAKLSGESSETGIYLYFVHHTRQFALRVVCVQRLVFGRRRITETGKVKKKHLIFDLRGAAADQVPVGRHRRAHAADSRVSFCLILRESDRSLKKYL